MRRKVVIVLILCLLVTSGISINFAQSENNTAIWSGQLMKDEAEVFFNISNMGLSLYDLSSNKIVSHKEFYSSTLDNFKVYIEEGNLVFENIKTQEKKAVYSGIITSRMFITQNTVYAVSQDKKTVTVFDKDGNLKGTSALPENCNFTASKGNFYFYSNDGYTYKKLHKISSDQLTPAVTFIGTFVFALNNQDRLITDCGNGFCNEIIGRKVVAYDIEEASVYCFNGQDIYYVKNDHDVYKWSLDTNKRIKLFHDDGDIRDLVYCDGKLFYQDLYMRSWAYDMATQKIKKPFSQDSFGVVEFNGKKAIRIESEKNSLLARNSSGKVRTIVEDGVITFVYKDKQAYYIDEKGGLKAVDTDSGKVQWELSFKTLTGGKNTFYASDTNNYGLSICNNRIYYFSQNGSFVVDTTGKLIKVLPASGLQYRGESTATYYSYNGCHILDLINNTDNTILSDKKLTYSNGGYTTKLSLIASDNSYNLEISKGKEKKVKSNLPNLTDLVWIDGNTITWYDKNKEAYVFSFISGKLVKDKQIYHAELAETYNKGFSLVIGWQESVTEVKGYNHKKGLFEILAYKKADSRAHKTNNNQVWISTAGLDELLVDLSTGKNYIVETGSISVNDIIVDNNVVYGYYETGIKYTIDMNTGIETIFAD